MKELIFFGLAVLVSLAGELAPKYVALLSRGDLKSIGALDSSSSLCSESEEEGLRCSDRYRIRANQIRTQIADPYLGLGIIIGSIRLYCDNQAPPHHKATPHSNINYLNEYRVVDLDSLKCQGHDVMIDVWVPKSFRRHGYTGSPMVIGPEVEVEKAKSLVEFFTSTLPIIFTFLFVVVISFEGLFSAISASNTKSAFEVYGYAWMAFMAISSGLVGVLFPISSSNLVLFRLSNFFSWIAHFGSGLLLILHKSSSRTIPETISGFLLKPRFKRVGISYLTLIAAILASSPYFGVTLAPAAATFAIFFCLAGITSRKLSVTIYALALVLDVSTQFELSALPQARLAVTFVLFSVIDAFFNKVRSSSEVLRTLRWLRTQLDGTKQLEPSTFLESFAAHFRIRQVSLLELGKAGDCKIIQSVLSESGWDRKELFLPSVPPIFAHVLSTREPLIHIAGRSILSQNLRKGETTIVEYPDGHYSVLPLLKDGVPVGGVAFTDYSTEYASNEEKRLEFSSALTSSLPILASSLSGRNYSNSEEWVDVASTLAKSINRLETNTNNSKDDFNLIASLVASTLKLKCIIMQLDSATRQLHIKGMSGYSDAAKNAYLNSYFYAVPHNEQGPAALAINRGHSIIIPDVNWLSAVLHKQTITAFRVASTRSCAAVPLFHPRNSKDNNSFTPRDAWGLLWLESETLGGCTPSMDKGLNVISSAVESIVSQHQLHELNRRTHSLLQGFVPDSVLKKLIAGEVAREEEVGILLMADLRDSTKISRSVGADAWTAFTIELAKIVAEISKEYGFTLQTLVWDAFYLTHSTLEPGVALNSALTLSEVLNAIFRSAVTRKFGLYDDGSPRARFCITYGDITRDIRSSWNNNWTIVGTAMASVSKLEQASKMLDGWLFSASSLKQDLLLGGWKDSGVIVNGTGERVLVFERSPAPVPLKSNVVQAIKNIVQDAPTNAA